MPCSSASRPWPETWSACVWVSSVRTSADAEPLRLAEDGLDRERRVDDDRLLGLLAADEVRRAAEVVVQRPARRARRPTLAAGSAIALEVGAAGGSRSASEAAPRSRASPTALAISGAAEVLRRRVSRRGGEDGERAPASARPRRRRSAGVARNVTVPARVRAVTTSGNDDDVLALDPSARSSGRTPFERSSAQPAGARGCGELDTRGRHDLERRRRVPVALVRRLERDGGRRAAPRRTAARASRARAVAARARRRQRRATDDA